MLLLNLITNSTQKHVFYWPNWPPPQSITSTWHQPSIHTSGKDLSHFHFRFIARVISKASIRWHKTGTGNCSTNSHCVLKSGSTLIPCKDFEFRIIQHQNSPRDSSQTWTYFVKFDKTFSLISIWFQLMLPFISYGMKNEANRGSFLLEFSARGPQRILSMAFYYSNDPPLATLQFFFKFT